MPVKANYTVSAWFSSYITQGDYSDLTLSFADDQGNGVDNSVPLGGQAFVAAIPTATYGKLPNAKYWARMRSVRPFLRALGPRSSPFTPPLLAERRTDT